MKNQIYMIWFLPGRTEPWKLIDETPNLLEARQTYDSKIKFLNPGQGLKLIDQDARLYRADYIPLRHPLVVKPKEKIES